MFWKTDRGIINIKSYKTIEEPYSKLHLGKSSTIIKDPIQLYNHTVHKVPKDTGSMSHWGS